MENKFMKFVNENKWFIVFFLVWSFIHIILLFSGDNENGFWPFNKHTEIDDYGYVEFFVYETLPLLIFLIVKLVGKDIKKAIDENN
jgi:hypothetical protein